MWFGYARLELLPANGPRAVAQAIRDYAARAGFGEGTVVFEPMAGEVLLHGMITEIDRANPTVPVLRQLAQIAQSWGVDLDEILDPRPRAEALWQIAESMEHAARAHLIVPAREHLADLGPSGRAAVAALTRARNVRIHHLDAPAENRQPPAHSRSGTQVLVESRIGAIPAVAQLDAATELFRLGQSAAIIQSVDAIYAALINDVTTPAARLLEFPTEHDPVVIRLLTTTHGRLLVELEEPHPHTTEVADSLHRLCESAHRYIDGGRTFTRCALPSEAPDAAPGDRE